MGMVDGLLGIGSSVVDSGTQKFVIVYNHALIPVISLDLFLRINSTMYSLYYFRRRDGKESKPELTWS